MSDGEHRARAEARRGRMWIRRVPLGAPEPLEEGTPEQRIELAAELSRAAWEMTGNRMPPEDAARSVVRFVRRADPR